MSLPDAQRERLIKKLEREIHGPIQTALMEEDVTEVILNPNGQLWKIGRKTGWELIDELSAIQSDSIVTTVATLTDNTVTKASPEFQCAFPLCGSRFQGIIPPAVSQSSFTIRKHSPVVYSLADYVKADIITPEQSEVLAEAIAKKKNILVSGGTASGKTTLTNTLIRVAVETGEPGERFILIEDTRELQCSTDNVVSLHAYTREMLSQFAQVAMRLRPDRVIVGEVRGREAYDLMYLLNSGHPGSFTTIHANNARMALHKFLMLARKAGETVHPIEVSECFDLVLSIRRTSTGLKLKELSEVISYDGSDFIVNRLCPKDEREGEQ